MILIQQKKSNKTPNPVNKLGVNSLNALMIKKCARLIQINDWWVSLTDYLKEPVHKNQSLETQTIVVVKYVIFLIFSSLKRQWLNQV